MKLFALLAEVRPLAFVRARWRPIAGYAALALVVVVVWSAVYGRIPGTARFRLPAEYHGDALAEMAIMQGFSELSPPWNLHVHRLNAPFGADWNDYPHAEKLLFYTGGVLARFMDLGAAVNLLVLLGFVTNALAFAWTARRLGASWLTAGAGSLMFAFSAYALWRGLAHLILLYACPIPILFYLYHRLQQGSLDRRALWIGSSIYIWIAAFLNPYYFVFVLLMLSLAALRILLNQPKREVLLPAVLLGQGALAFVFNQSNVLLYRLGHGANSAFLGRNLAEQMRFGLRIPDLFMPYGHPIELWSSFARSYYFVPGIGDENTAAFLGLAGCVGLVALLAVSVAKGMRGQYGSIASETWFVLVAYVLGATGGGTMLLGVFGFSWLRASARYSIVILCAVLLWAARTFKLPRHPRLAIPVWLALAAFAIVEAPYSFASFRNPDPARSAADRSFAAALEQQLPRGAAVFQIPVLEFPEIGRIFALSDYEPFRPYFWSRHLRFSYGAHRGRAREKWQAACAGKPVSGMISELLDKGFAAILVQRAGYPDRGLGIEAALRGAGLSRVAGGDTGDMVAYRLR